MPGYDVGAEARITTPVTLPDWDLRPEDLRELIVEGRVVLAAIIGQGETIDVENADLAPVDTLDVVSGTAADEWSEWTDFSGTTVRLDIYSKTNPLHVQVKTTVQSSPDTMSIPTGKWVAFDLRATSIRFKNENAGNNADYQAVGSIASTE